MKNDNNLSRRQFLGIAGASAGVAAATSMGLSSGWGENHSVVDENQFVTKEFTTEVLVVGGGMAGLFAAVKAHDAGAQVMMVSKGRLGSSGQTPFAKGIFDYDPETAEYTIPEFEAKVAHSARGTNNSVYTKQVAKYSHDRIKDLREWGFFDSPLCNRSFRNPIDQRNITVVERLPITHLVKDSGKVIGAAGFSIDTQELYFFHAKSVVLCTGAGGFKPNGFPICDLTHDGTVMAYNIGAKVTGKEWNDGHPGKATNAAACYDGWGNMFEQTPSTTSISIRHDLGVDLNYQAYVNGNPVQMGPPSAGGSVSGGPQRPKGLDVQGGGPPGPSSEGKGGGRPDGPPPGGKHQGPSSGKHSGPPGGKEGGAPPGMGGVSVGGSSAGMAIHKSEGLVPINDRCESTIPGLFAAGDALGSYMAGAIYTQIGSSLAGSAVQGAIAGEAAAEVAKNVSLIKIPVVKQVEIMDEVFGPLKKEAGYSPAWVTQTLQGIMIPNFVLYIKKESMMRAALSYVEELRDHHLPMLKAADLHELRLAHETVNMVVSAEMKLRASLMRTESRCSHYRTDYPDVDDANWRAWINISKDQNGAMRLEKQPFTDWNERG